MILIAITAEDAKILASLHAHGFSPSWGVEDIVDILASPGAFGLAARNRGALAGFVIARTVADESEILTLVVDPGHRRQGIGRALLEAAAQLSGQGGANALFLEVDAGNDAAIALYQSDGFSQVGLRPGYYASGGDALILRRPLNSRAGPDYADP